MPKRKTNKETRTKTRTRHDEHCIECGEDCTDSLYEKVHGKRIRTDKPMRFSYDCPHCGHTMKAELSFGFGLYDEVQVEVTVPVEKKK